MKYIVAIKGELEGDYEIIGKYAEKSRAKWQDSSVISCGKILRWRQSVTEQQCSKCKRWVLKWSDTNDYDYCPHCKADMRGEKK